MDLWQGVMSEPRKLSNFRDIVGENPSEWFLATQCLPGGSWKGSERAKPDAPSKGMLAHFESTFSGYASLSRLVGYEVEALR